MIKQLADETGGVAFLHLSRKELPKIFAAIKDQIDNMHLLSYVPADPDQSGRAQGLLRRVENRVGEPSGLSRVFPLD